MAEKVEPQKFGIGLDVGTGFLISSWFENNEMKFNTIRNCFVTIDKRIFNPSLFGKKIKYMEMDNDIIIVGDDAMEFAKIRNMAAQRPMAKGIINPSERKSATILKEIFNYILENCVKKENEKLVFSVPGKQIYNPDFDTTYHSMSIQSLCKSFGVNAEPINEAYAIAISELGNSETLTALSFSFGAGLVNACLTYKGMSLFEFSIDEAGDFIDKQSAIGVGESDSLMCHIKERELDLSANESEVSPEIKALIFSYRYVVENILSEVKKAFSEAKGVRILEKVPIIISGGTSVVKGFLDLFKNSLKTAYLPFEVGEVTSAKDPLKAVAKGCLLAASYTEETK